MNSTDFSQKIANLRREYTAGGLRRRDLPAHPLTLFSQWLQQACDAQLPDPTAMCVATVDANAQPWQRIVLLKYYDENGLLFYTNMQSRKALQLAENPQISLLFPWHMLERQVIISGTVTPLDKEEVLHYFHHRPRESQIGAWASCQSQIIASRAILEQQFQHLKQHFQEQEIPLPEYWRGFRVVAKTFEFWQGGAHRLHDRFLWQHQNDHWQIDRLSP